MINFIRHKEMGVRCDVYLMQVLLVTVLLFSVVTCDVCPDVGTVPGWNTTCATQRDSCGNVPVISDMPAAPSRVAINDVRHRVNGELYLGLNILWHLPKGNVSGLKGFRVELMKTSYPVGFHECSEVLFGHELQVPSFTSEVIFNYSGWQNVAVDSIYTVTITSLGSGNSVVTPSHHTKSCAMAPGVHQCPSTIDSVDEWRATQKPIVAVNGDTVTVMFQVYPGDFWLDYRVNLQPCGKSTPQKLSHIVNTNGTSGTFSYIVENVPPGCYHARVIIKESDGYESQSKQFNVSEPAEVPQTPTEVPQTPAEVPQIPAVVQTSEITPNIGLPSTVTYSILEVVVIAAGVTVGVALLVYIFVRRKRKMEAKRRAEIPAAESDKQSTDRSNLVNNIFQHDDQGGVKSTDDQLVQNNFYNGWKPDSVSVLEDCGVSNSQWTADYPPDVCVHVACRDILQDLPSVTGMSGITV